MKKIFITGGTGFLGRFLTSKLIRAGHAVTVLCRQLPRTVNAAQPADYIELDAFNRNSAISSFSEADVVINLAGENIGSHHWTRARKKILLDSRVDLTRKIVGLMNANTQKEQRLINASAIGYYGAQQDNILTENSPAGNGFLAEVCTAWENEAHKLNNAERYLTILRIGIVLHSRMGALPKMALPIKLFVGGKLGSGHQILSWIHFEDILSIFQFLIDNPQLSGVFNATAPQPVSNREMTRALGKVLHRPALFPVPSSLLKIVLGEQSTLILDGQHVLPQRLLENGFEFKYPELESALRQIYL